MPLSIKFIFVLPEFDIVSLQVIDTETGQKSCEVKSIKTELSVEASKNLNKRQPSLNRQLSGGDKTSDGELIINFRYDLVSKNTCYFS